MSVSSPNTLRNTAFFTGMIFMMSALFMPRAVLSISVIVLFVISLVHTEHKKQLRTFFSKPLLWATSLLFFVTLFSGLWSEDVESWKHSVQVKLPLLALPLAFATPVSLTRKQWEILAWIFIGLIASGAAWSLFHYISDWSNVNEAYLRAKTMITPLENDRVRFSWIVALAALLAGWIGLYKMKNEKVAGILLLLIAGWLMTYLHLLAVRTGIITLYMGLFLIAIAQLFNKRKYAWAILSLLIILPVVAYFLLPAFQNRVKYLRYEFDFAKHADYIPGSNDPVRVISFRAGISQLVANPLTGVGFGDIKAESRRWYEKNYPAMKEEDMILPSSEYLVYAAGAGIGGLLVLVFVVTIPFFMKVKRRLPWIILNAAIAFSFLFDIPLEVQFGVFLYCFCLLACWKWMETEKN